MGHIKYVGIGEEGAGRGESGGDERESVRFLVGEAMGKHSLDPLVHHFKSTFLSISRSPSKDLSLNKSEFVVFKTKVKKYHRDIGHVLLSRRRTRKTTIDPTGKWAYAFICVSSFAFPC